MFYLTISLAIAKLLRPRHWVKNGFVLAPLFFAPASLNSTTAIAVATGFLAFCAAAGATYAFNDIFDCESDRHHPEKKNRPVAAGVLSLRAAAGVSVLAAAIALIVALTLASEFAAILLLYLALNAAYSMWLKRVPAVDVAIIAFGFILRIYAGGVLIHIPPSAWIVIMTGLLALFLALAKRRGNSLSRPRGERGNEFQHYPPVFLNIAISLSLGGLLAGYVAYCFDSETLARLGTEKMYYTVPFVVVGILRYLQLAFVKNRSSDPTRLLFSDALLAVIVMSWIATLAALLYF